MLGKSIVLFGPVDRQISSNNNEETGGKLSTMHTLRKEKIGAPIFPSHIQYRHCSSAAQKNV